MIENILLSVLSFKQLINLNFIVSTTAYYLLWIYKFSFPDKKFSTKNKYSKPSIVRLSILWQSVFFDTGWADTSKQWRPKFSTKTFASHYPGQWPLAGTGSFVLSGHPCGNKTIVGVVFPSLALYRAKSRHVSIKEAARQRNQCKKQSKIAKYFVPVTFMGTHVLIGADKLRL
jgi:hypothetical protein